MKIAFINSNIIDISKNTSKGTEVFIYTLIRNLLRNRRSRKYEMTAFASGNSKLPIKTISVTDYDLMSKEEINDGEYYKFEQLLISKAFQMQNVFDMYHVNMGNGELVLPFAPFIRKPILVTLHWTFIPPTLKEYFTLVEKYKNIYFVAISDAQRRSAPHLNYVKTIHHGVDTNRNFKFSPLGGKSIMWAGRAVPEKGLDVVLQVIKGTKKQAHLFMLTKIEFLVWLQNKILKQLHSLNRSTPINAEFNLSRLELIPKYQNSKLFLSPIQWEEPFGFVMVESLSCGTPVVAYARGSVPEIIKDGVTGFIVNPSDDDIRGDYIIKQTGVKGLIEAVERIYAMSDSEYQAMRLACRQHVLDNFTVERMVEDYISVYRQITQ